MAAGPIQQQIRSLSPGEAANLGPGRREVATRARRAADTPPLSGTVLPLDDDSGSRDVRRDDCHAHLPDNPSHHLSPPGIRQKRNTPPATGTTHPSGEHAMSAAARYTPPTSRTGPPGDAGAGGSSRKLQDSETKTITLGVRRTPMVTIVTHVHLKERAGHDWDTAMHARLAAARKRPGWVGGQLLRPADREDKRVIVGTWRTRADWKGWHHDPQFAETRQRLDGLESAPAEHWWHDVVLDVRKTAAPPPPTSKSLRKRKAQGKTKSPRRRST